MNPSLYDFKDGGTRCEIHTPEPPRHWYNYLWNENGYCAQISQSGYGRSYYINEKADMCRINRDGARYIYLRDDESQACWNIGKGPLGEPVENFRCVHEFASSEISSACQDIHGTWQIVVPPDGWHELWTLTLRNDSDRPRRLSVFSAVNFELEGFSYPRYYEMYRCLETSFDRRLNGLFCASAHPFAPHKRYNGFLASSEPVFAYDGDLTMFCGAANTVTELDASSSALFQHPKIVVEGLNCTNSDAALFIPGAALQHKIFLLPGESKRICFAFGVAESLDEARRTAQILEDTSQIERRRSEAERRCQQKYSSLTLKTPDKRINHILGNWVKKQVDFCIVGKKGVRDNLQIAVALLNYRQEKAKEEILECLRHQFQDGHAVLTWYPYDDTRYSDQPFWIIWAVCELMKETGDFSILNQQLEWQDGGTASVLDHVKAAVNCLNQDIGPNGLVRIRFADWNDALNITTDPDAESVMLSHQFCLALRELRRLMEQTGDLAYAAELAEIYDTMKARINDTAWDGEYYMRALSKDENIGSRSSEGSKIYLNAQTWAVLADVVPKNRLPALIRSVDAMEHDFGFPLNLPPYKVYSPHIGRMAGMLPGLFENGGVYCHATGFKLLMDCKLGRADKALETIRKIMPDNDKNPVSQSGAEPYVFTNCYATHQKYYGKSYQSWTTGTSAWCMMGIYEGILGVKRDYGGLRIEPCFPREWGKAEMTRHFRGADYHITIQNPGHLEAGKPVITVDGKKLNGTLLPDFQDGMPHKVIVTLT